MPLSVKEALESYGFVGEMANAIPALKSIFTQAAREEWAPTKLNLAIRDSKWFKTYGESARAWITLNATDPATAERNVASAGDKIRLMLNEMGLPYLDRKKLDSVARQAIMQNLDDQQLRVYLTAHTKGLRLSEGVLGGQAGELEEQMFQIAQSYGQSFTHANVRGRIEHILDGSGSLQQWEDLMRARAKAQYSHFADQIDAGFTVRDIADPYVSTMANTLEMSETDIDLRDTWIKKALARRNDDGTSGSMPLWEFERQLKNDPRWDKTKQARNQAFDVVSQIGRDFGLVGS